MSRKTQITFFTCLFAYCSAYNILIPFCFDLIEKNQTESIKTNRSLIECYYIDIELQLASNYVDAANREIIPSILMIFFSYLLVKAIFRSRARTRHSIISISADRRSSRDLRLAISCFSMNFIFILLNTPESVMDKLSNIPEFYVTLATYFLYFSYGINFYIIFLSNSLFRKELFKIFGTKHSLVSQHATGNISQTVRT